MPQIQFEGLAQSLARLPQVIQSIPDIMRDPSANPLQAAILLGVGLILALIVLLSIVLVVVRPPAEAEYYYDEETGEYVESEGGEVSATGGAAAPPSTTRLTVASLLILIIVAIWAVGGITTASPEVCTSCHTDTVHSAAKTDDPHRTVKCVDCHESGGVVARATVNVLTRAEHIILAQGNATAAKQYGAPVASDACLRCHRSQIRGVVVDQSLQVRVSHAEPLDAGAACVDCHALNSGVVDATTVGMAPCLRCHDSKKHDGKLVSAQCPMCHLGDPSAAITPDVPRDQMAAAQVPNPVCTGCHTDMTVCNNCHGLQMPHSDEFKAYGHALYGARDIWNNNQRTCRHCHYPGHNDCQQERCHRSPFPSHPSPAWKNLHGITSYSHGSQNCPCHRWNPYDHNGLGWCQVCHATRPPGSKP